MPLAAEALSRLRLLRELPQDILAQAALRMTERWFTRREVVFNKAEKGEAIGFLLEGRLQATDFTVDGREVGLSFIEPGDFFGELAVIDGKPRDSYVIALARSHAAFLPSHKARELWLNHPGVAEQMMLRLAERIRHSANQRTLLSLPHPLQRVSAQIMQLVQTRQTPAADATPLPTHQEIAIMVNLSRETVTRAFQLLQAQGIIRRVSSTVIVVNPDLLRRLAEGSADLPKS